MQPATGRASQLLTSARALAPTIDTAAGDIERTRALSPNLADALHRSGLIKASVPVEFGGDEADPLTLIKAIEQIAAADGSVGWCLAVALQSGLLAGFMPSSVAAAVFGSEAPWMAWVNKPTVIATAVADGFELTGRWRYASSCKQATWFAGGCTIYDGGSPRVDAQSKPVQMTALFPAASMTIHDTWHVTGLRGSGSHDVSVSDLFVSPTHMLPLLHLNQSSPAIRRPLYLLGNVTLFASFAAVSLGIGQGALDAFVATLQQPERSALRQSDTAKNTLGRASTQISAARALLHQSVANAWSDVTVTGQPSAALRGAVRDASVHASSTAAAAVEQLWYASGSSAMFEGHPLERRFRDAHAAAQRYSNDLFTQAGQALIDAQ